MEPVPLLPGFYPDPSICRSPLGYFLVTSSCEYYPGIPLFHSKDLSQWSQIGHVLNRPSQLNLEEAEISRGIFAPTIRFHEGSWFVISTVYEAGRRRGNFVVQTTDPFGDWSDPLWLDAVKGIDPDLFWDDDGTCYTQWSDREAGFEHIHIAQAAIDLDSGGLLEQPRALWEGSGGVGPEGPHIYRIGDWYYLFIAEGGTEYGHMQTIARSRTVRGPWETCPRNPVLTHRSSGNPVQAVGHADLVKGPDGNWYGVTHGIRPRGYHRFHVLGRETFLYPLYWDEAGWPVIGDHGRLPSGLPAVAGRTVVPVSPDFEDDFFPASRPVNWTYLRNPLPENYQCRGTGEMVLKGSRDPITSKGQPTWLGVRQGSHACEAKATLAVPGRIQAGAEYGLTAFQNYRAHACIGFREEKGGPVLFTRTRLGQLTSGKSFPLPAAKEITLVIKADDLYYQLGIMDGNGRFQALGDCEARFLSTEVAGMFTGVFFALYAEGDATLHCTAFSIHKTR